MCEVVGADIDPQQCALQLEGEEGSHRINMSVFVSFMFFRVSKFQPLIQSAQFIAIRFIILLVLAR